MAILFVGNSFIHGRGWLVRGYNTAAVKDENYGLPKTDPRHELLAEDKHVGPYGGIPAIFKKLTDEAGLPYDVHLEAISAQTLEYHYKHALAVIAQPAWDAVVLQGYSTEALPGKRGGRPENFVKYAVLLEQAIHAANPAARVYLYATWPRADKVYPASAPYAGEPLDAMAQDLDAGYERAFAEDGHFAAVAPVGDAWMRAIRAGAAQANPFVEGQDDKIDLWADDDYHPSAEGAYLAALVLFQQITGADATRFGGGEQAAADLGIDPADAVKLQRTAAEQVAAGIATPAAPNPAATTPPPGAPAPRRP